MFFPYLFLCVLKACSWSLRGLYTTFNLQRSSNPAVFGWPNFLPRMPRIFIYGSWTLESVGVILAGAWETHPLVNEEFAIEAMARLVR